MKKILYVFFIINLCNFFLFTSTVFAKKYNTNNIIDTQKNSLNIFKFIGEAENYKTDFLNDIDLNEVLNSAITGNIDNSKLIKNLLKIFGKEITHSISSLGSIIFIIIIHSFIKAISDSINNKSVSQIAYYIQYILIITLVMFNFSEILEMVKTSIKQLAEFINLLLPILIILMIATGSIVSATIIQPIILFTITFVTNLITNLIIPLVLVSTALGIISQISDKIQIDKLSKFLKSTGIWILGIIMTLFVGITSLETSLTSSVDDVTSKTAKAAVSNCIPVVGKILGDAVETVIGCSGILKSSIGILGVIIIIGICITPIIKLTVLLVMYYLVAAVCQPIADPKIIKLLEQMGDVFKILLGLIISVSVMLIIGITIIIKIIQ